MNYLLLVILFIIIVRIQKIFRFLRDRQLGWKAYKKSYKEIIYSENINGEWNHILIDAHINIGTFEPLFKDKNQWSDYPQWAQNRDEIVERVKLRYPLKDEINEIGK